MKLWLLIIFSILGFSRQIWAREILILKSKGYYQEQDWMRKAEILEEVFLADVDDSEIEYFSNETELIIQKALHEKDQKMYSFACYVYSHMLATKENFTESLKLATKIKKYYSRTEEFRILAYLERIIGVSNIGLGNYLEALENFTKSVRFFKKTEDILNSTHSLALKANTLSNLGKMGQSFVYYEQCIRTMKKNKKYKTLFSYYNQLSDIYSEINDTAMVAWCNQKSYESAVKSKNQITIALAKNNLAIAHFYKGNIQKSLELFHSALNTRMKYGKKRLICESYFNIGSVYQEIEDFQNAKIFFSKSQSYALKHSLLPSQADATMALAEIYKNMGDFRSANEMNEEYIKIQEKIHLSSLQTASNQQNILAELDKSSVYQPDKDKKNNYYMMFIILLFGYLILAAWAVSFLVQKRKKANSF